MKVIGQKAYHQQEKELWVCMTETEREEYRAFLEEHTALFNEILNNDRRYYRNNSGQSDIEFWEQIESANNVVNLTPTTSRRGTSPGPDFVELIAEAECHRNSKVYYRDDRIAEAVAALSERQRRTLELTVIYGFSIADLAKMWACSERNVRKLRERALHNVCEKYAAALKKKPGHTLAEREFLKWYDARTAAPKPPVKEKKRRQGKWPARRYKAEYGQYPAPVPIHTDLIKERAAV